MSVCRKDDVVQEETQIVKSMCNSYSVTIWEGTWTGEGQEIKTVVTKKAIQFQQNINYEETATQI